MGPYRACDLTAADVTIGANEFEHSTFVLSRFEATVNPERG